MLPTFSLKGEGRFREFNIDENTEREIGRIFEGGISDGFQEFGKRYIENGRIRVEFPSFIDQSLSSFLFVV